MSIYWGETSLLEACTTIRKAFMGLKAGMMEGVIESKVGAGIAT